MTATWKIGYRSNDKTGNIKPLEVVNEVYENGKRTARVQWSSFKTEASAAASIPKGIAKMKANPIWAGKEFENIGRLVR